MLHLKNIVKAPIKKELTNFLPVAINIQQQRRGYAGPCAGQGAGHKIPDRLQHIPTAENPKFFDMVNSVFPLGFHFRIS